MQSDLVGKFVIIRTHSAGVHAGILETKDGKEVRLSDSYRIWYWDVPKPGTGSLSAVALHGVGKNCKVAGPVSMIELTEAVEIMATTDIAEQSIRNGKWTA